MHAEVVVFQSLFVVAGEGTFLALKGLNSLLMCIEHVLLQLDLVLRRKGALIPTSELVLIGDVTMQVPLAMHGVATFGTLERFRPRLANAN